ncbi:MAG TPA: hypothetical protein PK796_12000 [Bacteroidales bacterium]|nr:hypothetical protein [Bacteroidales bacterium]
MATSIRLEKQWDELTERYQYFVIKEHDVLALCYDERIARKTYQMAVDCAANPSEKITLESTEV